MDSGDETKDKDIEDFPARRHSCKNVLHLKHLQNVRSPPEWNPSVGPRDL